MKNAHGVELESTKESLLKLNRDILKTAKRGSELILDGAHPDRVNIEIDTLRMMFSRRDILLRELKKKGGTERELYFREAGKCTG